ncbi:MAG: V-type ATPase subunit [Synergistaceae bacterium]|nr:V-type ATPase subunit [Synergistaceae bacterium]
MSYVYAVARLRGMENHLLDTAFFSRLMDSPSIEEALKALGETSYAQWLAQTNNNFDKAIDAEILATCAELGQFVPDKDLLTLYRMPYDFHNVKVLLKGLFKVRAGDLNARRYDLLSKLGMIDTDELIEAVETEELGFLPYKLNDVIPQCWVLWDQTKNAQAVDILIDHAMFKAMLNIANKLDIADIIQWVKAKIDAENLRSAIRLARMNYDAAKGLTFFHEGGSLTPGDLAKLLNEPRETWGKLLSHTDIGATLETLQEQGDINAALSDISKSLDEYLIKILEKTKYATNKPASVLLYLLNKEAEARNMRIALVCVAGGLDREFARRLLNHVK